MTSFLRMVSPKRAIVDLWQYIGAPSEFKWRSFVMAACVTGGIAYVMIQQEGRGLPHPPKVIYFESLAPDRTDKEIIAGNIAATKKARAEEAEEEARREDIRQMYKAVGAATGLDTQKMYEDGKKEREAEKQAEAAKNAAILKNNVIVKSSGDGVSPQN